MHSNRGKRIFRETSEAPVWYLQLWQSLSVDFTNENGIVSRIDKSGFLRIFGNTIMPGIATFLIISPIMNTWQTLKNYYHANNKNLDKTLDLIVNLWMTATSVGVMVALMAGFVFVSPYILLGAMGVSLSYGIYNVIKHIYGAACAFEDDDHDRRRQHLWAMVYHAILTILSGLGLLVQLHYAFNIVVFNGIFKIVQISNTPYNVAQVLLYVFGSMLTLSTMPAFARMVMEYNMKTLAVLTNPLPYLNELIFGKEAKEGQDKVVGVWERMQNAFTSAKQQPLQALLYFIPNTLQLVVEAAYVIGILVGRLVAAVLAPVQLLAWVVTKAYGIFDHIINPPPKISNLSNNPISQHSLLSMENSLERKHAKLASLVDAKIEHLRVQQDTPKILAKLFFMRELQHKLGSNVAEYDNIHSIDEIETEARTYSSHLYQSFWRPEGGVEKIARQFEEFEDDVKKVNTLKCG